MRETEVESEIPAKRGEYSITSPAVAGEVEARVRLSGYINGFPAH